MKWINPGHELDSEAEVLVNQFLNTERFYIYGAGLKGRKLLSAMNHFKIPVKFVDRDIKRQDEGYYGTEVLAPEAFFEGGGCGSESINYHMRCKKK